MSLVPLDRESEPYSRFGNISAEGIQRLLGAPHLDALQVLLRETVQNSWDAGMDVPGPVDYLVRFRTLTREQRRVLRDIVFRNLPEYSQTPERSIRDMLHKEKIRVVEICDSGTTGLGGPTQPEVVPEDEESPDFVDFMRNIGSQRNTVFGGGTYGYGKSCLYAVSECQTIVVDSVTCYQGSNVRRLMASRIATRYDVDSGPEKGRYTGRHWWGRRLDNSHLEPVTASFATVLSEALGMSRREENQTGTSIMILDPKLDEGGIAATAERAVQILLWYCWPKMVAYEGAEHPPMRFRVEFDGEELEIPPPDGCPPLGILADSLRAVRARAQDSTEIRSKRPAKHLGRLHLNKAIRASRLAGFDSEESLFPEILNHVALMRPAELVVRYQEGQPLPSEKAEWGGVFMCSDEEEVELAFAASEPPAHDDWDPRSLPRGAAKTYVNVALRELKSHMAKMTEVLPIDPSVNGERTSLAAAADSLGTFLGGETGQRIGGRDPGVRRPRKGGNRGVSLTRPVFTGHETVNGRNCALFDITARTTKKVQLRLTGTARILRDDGGSDSTDSRGAQVSVVGWRNKGELHRGSHLDIHLEPNQTTVTAVVALPETKAITFSATYEELQ